jgi:hypothetical protein
VPWIRYKSYLDRDALIKRFGKKKGEKVNLDFTPKGAPGDDKGGAPPTCSRRRSSTNLGQGKAAGRLACAGHA